MCYLPTNRGGVPAPQTLTTDQFTAAGIYRDNDGNISLSDQYSAANRPDASSFRAEQLREAMDPNGSLSKFNSPYIKAAQMNAALRPDLAATQNFTAPGGGPVAPAPAPVAAPQAPAPVAAPPPPVQAAPAPAPLNTGAASTVITSYSDYANPNRNRRDGGLAVGGGTANQPGVAANNQLQIGNPTQTGINI